MKSLSSNLKFVVSTLGVIWTTVNAATGSHLPAWSPPVATAIASALVWLVPNLEKLAAKPAPPPSPSVTGTVQS
jgi:hypothetical protein